MQDNIKNKLNQLNETRFMQCTTHICRTFWSVAGVLAPAALSAYLLITNPDKIVTVLGVFFAVVALFNLCKTAYTATATPVKKAKKSTK